MLIPYWGIVGDMDICIIHKYKAYVGIVVPYSLLTASKILLSRILSHHHVPDILTMCWPYCFGSHDAEYEKGACWIAYGGDPHLENHPCVFHHRGFTHELSTWHRVREFVLCIRV